MSNFLDFNKDEKVLYDNMYLDDYKIVVKMPLLGTEKKPEEKEKVSVKIEKFNLANNCYLTHY